MQDQGFNHRIIAKNFITAAENMFNEKLPGEGLVCLWIMNPRYTPYPLNNVIVRDMELCRQLLSSKMLPVLVKGRGYKISHDLIGDGILSTSHEAWHKQRIVIEKGFTQELIEKQFPMVVKTAEELVERFKQLHAEQ